MEYTVLAVYLTLLNSHLAYSGYALRINSFAFGIGNFYSLDEIRIFYYRYNLHIR